MGIASRISQAWSALTGRAGPSGGPGGASSGWGAGPLFTDAFQTKRSPTPWRLVEAYKAIVYFCVDVNAVKTASTPLRLYATTRRGQPAPRCLARLVPRAELLRFRERRFKPSPWLERALTAGDEVHEVLEHPLLDCLDDPNPEHDRRQLVDLTVRYLDVVGSCYWKPVAGPMGPASEIWPLQSQYVLPIPEAATALTAGYTYFQQEFKRDELVKFAWTSLRNPYGPGYSPAQAGFEYAGLEDKFVGIQDQVLGLGPRPGMLVSAGDGALGPGEPERARLEADLNRKFSRGGAGGVLVTSGQFKATPITYPPADLAGMEISKYDLERLANCFGVPMPYLTGDTNLANMQGSHKLHAERAIEPRCDLIASVLTRRLARPLDARLSFAFDPCLQEDEESSAKVFDLKLKNGSLTINEARAADGLGPVAYGDEPWLASTLRQPSEERPAPPAPPAPGKAPTPPEGEPDEGEEEEKPKEGEAARALLRAANALLALAEREDGRGHFREPIETQGRPRGGWPRWAADGRADRAGSPEVVRQAGEGGPGHDPPGRGRAAGPLPAAGGLRRPDVPGDDAPDRGLLGRGGQGDDRPAGGEDGARPRGVAGDQPPHPGEDRVGEPEVLQEHQRDDDPPTR